MRTRFTDSSARAWITRQDEYDGTLYPLVTIADLKTCVGSMKVIKDEVHPNFRARIARGEVIMSGCYIQTRTFDSQQGSFVTGPHPGWGSRTMAGYLVSAAAPDYPVRGGHWASDLELMQVQATNEAFAKAYSSSAESLVSLGEFRETLSMLKSPFKTAFAKLGKMAKRRATLVQRGKSFAEASTNTWLEYRLGWKPVLYDIQNIIEAYAEATSKVKPLRLVFRSSEGRIYKKSGSLTSSVLSSAEVIEYETNVHSRASAGVIVEIRDDSLYHTGRHAFGLTWQNVPTSAWELVPLSFVVDRFIDVGTWLKSNIPTPGMNILGSWCTTTEDLEFTCKGISWSNWVNTGVPVEYKGRLEGSHKETSKTMNRSVNVSPSVLPPLKVAALSIEQDLDHIALIVNKLLSFKR